ncbi:MAG: methyltransferase domain-containing protein [Alphaproteobacteria bacterium]|nr:methyltransferase domain-containing protein [Alphaproteobacteria bacterium]MBU0858993.1 methyltransferase domain-containing protein [Alphaproteobacteria bacterium]
MAKPSSYHAGSGDMLADRRFDMAQQFHERGDFEAAADLMTQVREIVPDWPPAAFRLGEILMAAGHVDGAAQAFNDYRQLDPADRMGATIKLALLGAEAAPLTLPNDYIASLFDEYAPRFDRHLVETLEYDVPQTLATAINRHRPEGLLRILDLGCGTGLSGAALQARASWLEGIDLSPRMIAEAEKKGLYHRLHTGDMLAFMRTVRQPYDLIVAADVFIYTGDLMPVFKAARPCLAPDGILAFSLQESIEAAHFTLGPDHRYAYSLDYVTRCAEQTGLSAHEIKHSRLRRDAGQDVAGLICVLGVR